jgi:hypothetical protein
LTAVIQTTKSTLATRGISSPPSASLSVTATRPIAESA